MSDIDKVAPQRDEALDIIAELETRNEILTETVQRYQEQVRAM